MLTLWLDKFGFFKLRGREKTLPADDRKTVKAIENDVNVVLDALPAYYFYECRSQLISRLCHDDYVIAERLQSLAARVLTRYPGRTLWSLVAALTSSDKTRQTAATGIWARAADASKSTKQLLAEAQTLVSQCIALCSEAYKGDEAVLSLAANTFKCSSGLVRAAAAARHVVLPVQSALAAHMPADNAFRSDDADDVQVFADNAPRCKSVCDSVRIFSSLQKPKRIEFEAHDGRHYYFLCKKDDDLRKDQRVIEFNTLINRLLAADPDARRRALQVRTYAAVPLSETTGLIEWVNNTTTLRTVLVDLYKDHYQWNSPAARELYESATAPEQRIENMRKLLRQHPSVLHRWFLDAFPDASEWLRARLRYTRAYAVMAMVGFVLG